jgi:hypothetical protein
VPSGHGDTVELMGFFHNVIANHSRQDLSDLVDQLWSTRMVVLGQRDLEALEHLKAA